MRTAACLLSPTLPSSHVLFISMLPTNALPSLSLSRSYLSTTLNAIDDVRSSIRGEQVDALYPNRRVRSVPPVLPELGILSWLGRADALYCEELVRGHARNRGTVSIKRRLCQRSLRDLHVSPGLSSDITDDYSTSCPCDPMCSSFLNERGENFLGLEEHLTQTGKTQDCNLQNPSPPQFIFVPATTSPPTSTHPSADPILSASRRG
jgi:hypothetical protein